ncbi:MAG TPA: hypothetical protein DIT67_01480 [Octadecabacter sp.]|nr:hypothetical protein [Octadecabacter sp.]
MGGSVFAALAAPAILRAAPLQVVKMQGSARGERVWFNPLGVAIPADSTVRFVNHDPGNGHTATAYHPDNFDRVRRIPQAAAPWDSDFLLPDESFEVTFTVPGVYDYYCIPHEMAAMVGRIVVGTPLDTGWEGPSTDTTDVSPEVLATLPTVEEIHARGRIEQKDGA